MTSVWVSIFAVLSIAIVAFHVGAWMATYPSTGAEGFWAWIGWPAVTTLLGLMWMGALGAALWRIIRARNARPILAVVVLACAVLTPEILSVAVNVPYKGISAPEFLDAFFALPGGVTPGGNGTLQHILTSSVVAGIAAVQIAHAIGRNASARAA